MATRGRQEVTAKLFAHSELVFTDSDGDTLDIEKVYGFGEPMLAVRVRQEDQEAIMNLNAHDAKVLAVYLDWFGGGCES